VKGIVVGDKDRRWRVRGGLKLSLQLPKLSRGAGEAKPYRGVEWIRRFSKGFCQSMSHKIWCFLLRAQNAHILEQ